MHAYLGALVDSTVAVDWRVDDRVVEVQHLLLRALVPGAGAGLVRRVEIGVGAERAQERSLVVRRAAHPAVGQPGPLGDRVARGHLLFGGLRRAEVAVGIPA